MAKPSNSFSFECPRCGTTITVGADSVGQPHRCLNCSADLIVPGTKPSSRADFDDLFEDPGARGDEAPSTFAEPPNATHVTFAGPPTTRPSPARPPEPEPIDDILIQIPDNVKAVTSGAIPDDPFAHDENSPLRIDEISTPEHLPTQIRVKCPICESVLFAAETQIGQKIQCSDCFTMIDVRAPEKHATTNKPPLDRSAKVQEPDRITAFPERDIEADEPIGDDYGLEPAGEDLLQPRADSFSSDLMEMIQETHFAPQAPQPLAPSGPEPSPPRAAQPGIRKSAIASGEKGSTFLPTNESELPKVEPPPPPLKLVPLSEQFKWPEQFLCVFRDLGALQFVAMVATMLALGYIVIDWGTALSRFQDVAQSGVKPYQLFGFGVVMIAGAIHLIAMVLAGIMINQTVEGAAYKRNVFHPPELDVGGLLSSFLIVGVSFWAGMLPGVVLGQLFWGATGRWWLTYVVAFVTAFVLAPIGVLGAYYNGSAFQIVSSEVVRSIRTNTAGWIRFYSWMAAWIVLFCLGWMFRMIPSSLIGSSLCGITQACSLLLMGRTLGLLAQAFINFWIDADER